MKEWLNFVMVRIYDARIAIVIWCMHIAEGNKNLATACCRRATKLAMRRLDYIDKCENVFWNWLLKDF